MDDDTCKLFERVAKKMGWTDNGGLDKAEKRVCCITDSYSNTRVKTNVNNKDKCLFVSWRNNSANPAFNI